VPPLSAEIVNQSESAALFICTYAIRAWSS
jgi:hypothetical protein